MQYFLYKLYILYITISLYTLSSSISLHHKYKILYFFYLLNFVKS